MAPSKLSFKKKLVLLASFLSSTQAGVVPNTRRSISRNLQLETAAIPSFAPRAPNTQTENFIRITRQAGSTNGAHWIKAIQAGEQYQPDGTSSPVGVGSLIFQNGVEYLATINFEGTDMTVIVDTGSSDTWLVESDFQCLDQGSNKVPQSQCQFGKTYPGKFKGPSLGQLQIAYGDGEFCKGTFGKANITVGGITVPQVQVRLMIYENKD
jgi:hypothetical protein